MANRQVYLSGRIVDEQDARISIFDSAVMLGDTVTESTRTFAHQPFKLEQHIHRLYQSLKVTRIDPGCTPAQMLQHTLDIFEANRGLLTADSDCWIVHNISRGLSIAGADPTVQHGGATIMIFTQPLDLTSWAAFYEQGCHAVTAMSRMIPTQALDARIKNRSRMAYTMAEMEVKLVDPQAQGIILDVDGNIGENKGGNVFAVSNGVIRTPPTANCLAGISRATVLELAQQLGITVAVEHMQPYDLYTADEVFFTSTPYCIMPATRFNGLPVGDGQVGPVAKQLLKAWGNHVGVDIAQQAQRQLNNR